MPLIALAATKAQVRPTNHQASPQHCLEKPKVGRYHLVHLIRSDLKLNIVGERFPVPPKLKVEYVVATIDIKDQKLKLFPDKTHVDELVYKIRQLAMNPRYAGIKSVHELTALYT